MHVRSRTASIVWKACIVASGIVGLAEMLAFVFDDKDAAVVEHGNEVGIEPVGGGLEAEGGGAAGEVACPELHFGQGVEVLGAFEFFGELAVGALFLQLARFAAEVVFLELESAFVEPARLVGHGGEVDGLRVGDDE